MAERVAKVTLMEADAPTPRNVLIGMLRATKTGGLALVRLNVWLVRPDRSQAGGAMPSRLRLIAHPRRFSMVDRTGGIHPLRSQSRSPARPSASR